jgi:hypothetical protein
MNLSPKSQFNKTAIFVRIFRQIIIVNSKVFVKKSHCHTSRYYHGICFEALKETYKNSVWIIYIRTEFSTLGVTMRTRSTILTFKP